MNDTDDTGDSDAPGRGGCDEPKSSPRREARRDRRIGVMLTEAEYTRLARRAHDDARSISSAARLLLVYAMNASSRGA